MKKTLGIILIVLGSIMIAYTGFNFATKEKVVDLGSIEISKNKNHFVQWSPLVGVILIAGGVLTMVINKKGHN
jgi:drug/metabolite transporter (DMT)-like permease